MTKKNNTYKKIIIEIIILTIAISITTNVIFALKNPSSVYCKAMGYEWVIETVEGSQMGVCKFSETDSCPALEFLQGSCGQDYSYCSKQGYELKTVNNPEICFIIPLASECSVCIVGGEEIEVTALMELSLEEGVCGDDKCVIGENYNNCPQDCSSGSADDFCDGIVDSICDQDCTPEEDLDCRCGDGICEAGETQASCCSDCGCMPNTKCVENECIKDSNKHCGNKKCEQVMRDENYLVCPEDCHSGYADGYCDKEDDNICDPDCEDEEDEDCMKKPISTTNLIIVGIIILALILIVSYVQFKKRTGL